MANSFHKLYYHLVFAPRYRRALIVEAVREPLERCIVAVVKESECLAVQLYAMPDHVHLLVRTPTTMAPSVLVNKVKSVSSRWMRHQVHPDFRWQTGGGYFTVGYRHVETVRRYIRNQPRHHRRITMQHEFRTLLTDHSIPPLDDYLLVPPH